MIYRFGDCALDTNLYTLQRGGQTCRLRLKVFRMCLYLLEHRDRVVSREELCTQVWPGQFVSQTTLEGVIRLVRQVVGDSGRTQHVIQTLHGHGYRFVASVEEHPPPITGGEPAQAAPLRNTLSASAPGHSAGIPIASDLIAVLEPEEPLNTGQPDERRHGAPRANKQGGYNRWGTLPGEHWGAQARVGWRWWMARMGTPLSIVTLVVVGAWSLWLGVRAQDTVPFDKSRIAVLPFIDLSAEVDQTYFADGITENLIAELARIHGLSVIARTSVMKYKGSLKDVATIGRELQVGTIVEGRVRRRENQVQITAQLIDVASQGHMWSQEYHRELTEVLGIQSDIATRVAQWLNVQVTAGPGHERLRADPVSGPVVQKMGMGQ
jgi:TolB-like protein/DNA-binding winged helix-turn-helix (wHTH) protein